MSASGLLHAGSGATATVGKPPVDPALFHSVLVHNVTHSDLLLGLAPLPTPPSPLSPSRSSSLPPAPPSVPSTSLPSLPLSSLIAQPKFHRYQEITQRIFRCFKEQRSEHSPAPVYFPSLHYNHTAASTPPSPPDTGPPSPNALHPSHPPPIPAPPLSTLPYGFSFPSPHPTLDSWDGLRLRSTATPSPSSLPPHPTVVAAFFPMLSVIIPKWLQLTQTKRLKREKLSELSNSSSPNTTTCPPTSSSSSSQPCSSNPLHLYLVSGGGQPWDRSLARAANSTQYTAQLCRVFLSVFYPSIQVHLIHSSTDIFHYDDNVAFVNTQLLPRLQSHRRDLAAVFYERWAAHLHTVLTITDGPPARVNAISASLRSFTPDCLHMWQLKSFWHEYPHVSGQGEDDVEYQNFEKLEMTPPVRVVECDEEAVRQTVARLVDFKGMFERKRDAAEYHEMGAFWMRKSRKPVLSVVMVESRRGGRRWYRGINMEVSMPTGSLCSERSAIGSALSDDVGLCRKDIKLIAVLALPLEGRATRDHELEELERKKEEELLQQMTTLNSTSPLLADPAPHVRAPLSPLQLHRHVGDERTAADTTAQSRIQEVEDTRNGVAKRGRADDAADGMDGDVEEANGDGHPLPKRRRPPLELSILTERSLSASSEGSAALDASPTFLPSARASVRDYLRQQQQLEVELLLMKIRREHHSGDDEGRNPMHPCGACNEWLKKIAEVNPDFRVITFTSTDCRTCFIKAVKF